MEGGSVRKGKWAFAVKPQPEKQIPEDWGEPWVATAFEEPEYREFLNYLKLQTQAVYGIDPKDIKFDHGGNSGR